MINNKYGWDLLRKVLRAFAEGYAEDMDNWSALREEQETWRGESAALRREASDGESSRQTDEKL
jgi:hypothetical protein